MRFGGGALLTPLCLAACTTPPAQPSDDGQRLVQAALRILASDGQPICVDNRTTGRPLAIYAAMRVAPPPSRHPLAWHVPGPLRPPPELSNRQIYRDSVGAETAHLREPDNAANRLPHAAQTWLDDNATVLSRASVGTSVTISPAWARGVLARWWPINRVSQHCTPTYVLSNPVWSASSGFVTVMTEHWGTTYGFDRHDGVWRPAGQWTTWLY